MACTKKLEYNQTSETQDRMPNAEAAVLPQQRSVTNEIPLQAVVVLVVLSLSLF